MGALTTAIVTAVIAIAKFDRGAWVVVILIPLMVLAFLGVRAYYQRPRLVQAVQGEPVQADVVFILIFSHQDVREPAQDAQAPQRLHPHERAWPQVLEQELVYAARIAPEIRVLRVVTDQEEADTFCAAWNRYLHATNPALEQRVRTEALISPYRTVVLPLTNFLRWRQKHDYRGKRVAVLVPREINTSWWEWPLQRRIASRVRQQLHRRRTTLIMVDMPYTLGSRTGTPERGHIHSA